MDAVRLLLADDHAMFREALAHVLQHEAGLTVVGQAAGGRAAVARALELAPDVVVLGVAVPQSDGLEAIGRILHHDPAAQVIVLSAFTDPRFEAAATAAGAVACVARSASTSDLVAAVRAVGGTRRQGSGRAPLNGQSASAGNGQAFRPPAGLGRREREVVQLIAAGMRGAEIAEKLHIAESTVEVHRRNIMRKLDIHGVAELTRYAIREGLCPL